MIRAPARRGPRPALRFGGANVPFGEPRLPGRRPIRSGSQVVTFVTDRKPTYAGIDPYTFCIDRNWRDNVVRLADPG